MGGSLDPVVAHARNLVRSNLGLAPGGALVVAVSGGADSLALAAVTAFVARKSSWVARAVVIDHGLQPGSGDVAAEAASQVKALGLTASVVKIEVTGPGGIEAAARAARQKALRAAAGDRTPILLGHTLDDQAETVLLGLGRGSGPRAIMGMRPVNPPWHRPFLTLRRSQTEAICRAHQLDWWQDPHNVDPRFRRVRVRREVMPLLEDVLGEGVAESLARTASLLREDAETLDFLAAQVRTDDIAELKKMGAGVRTRTLRLLALSAGAHGGELSAQHITALDRFVMSWNGQRRIELPGGVSAVREGNRLTFITTPVAG